MAKASKNTEVIELEAEEIPVEQKIEQTITEELQKANVTEAIISNLKEKYLPLKIKGQEDKETYATVVEARKDCKRWRILAEKVCKKGREAAVIEQKLWLAKEKDVAGRIEEVETYLEKQETAWEAERDRLKAEKKAEQDANYTKRTLQLTKMGAEFNGVSFVLGDISYDAALIRETDEDIYQSTIIPKYKSIFDQNEAIRIENERIKQEQEAELQRQRDELARQQQELAHKQEEMRKEQARIEEEKNKEAIRLHNEAREKESAKIRQRCAQLQGLGLKFDFDSNYYVNYNCFIHTLDISGYDDQKWDEMITKITPAIEELKKEEAQKEATRIENEKQAAIEKALAEEKERQRLEEQRKEDARIAEEQRRSEQLAQASDKEKWAIFIQQLSGIKVPECRSGQYRKKASISNEKIEEIVNL